MTGREKLDTIRHEWSFWDLMVANEVLDMEDDLKVEGMPKEQRDKHFHQARK